MVSRFIIISAAILLLGTVTFAQHQVNPLVNDNGDSTQFFKESKIAKFLPPKKRKLFSGLLTSGLSAHEKQATAPQTNAPTAPIASNQLPTQSNGGTPPAAKPKDSDEQAGDVFDAGDDQPDTPGGHEAKRSVESPFNGKPIAPGSVTAPFVTRRAAPPDVEDDDEDLTDDDDQEGVEEEDTGREAKRELKARIRDITKRDMDRFIMKTQIGVDSIIAKTSRFADKVGGGSDENTKPSGPGGVNLPDGHSTSDDTKHATDAVDHAKSISSSGKHGDIKAIRESH